MTKDKTRIFIFFGPPGAGKGEQAKRLSQALSLPHISSGELLRQKAKSTDPLGQQIHQIISSGHFPNDELVIQMIKERISKPDCQSGFILDGFPRNIEQCKVVDQHFKDDYELVLLNITIKEEELLKRLLGRRVCTKCPGTFHIQFLPPKISNQCDYCLSPLKVRTDDNKEVIIERFKVFQDKFSPIVSHYQNHPNWIDMISSGTPEQCFIQLLNMIESKVKVCTHAI